MDNIHAFSAYQTFKSKFQKALSDADFFAEKADHYEYTSRCKDPEFLERNQETCRLYERCEKTKEGCEEYERHRNEGRIRRYEMLAEQFSQMADKMRSESVSDPYSGGNMVIENQQ